MPRAMTIAEKILARHAGLDEVRPGQILEADIDLALGNDITAPIAIREFKNELGGGNVFDKDRVVLVPDHFTPNKDIQSAEQAKVLREFAHEQNLTNYFELGEMGVEHALLPEKGLVGPGELIIGADSHTCTYGGLGALSTGVGSTDLAAAMATGRLWFRVPETLRVEIIGECSKWVGAKDIILELIGRIGVDGARYMSIEFTGSGATALSIEGRLTIANMAIEAGGKCGIFASDEKTAEYLKDRAVREFKPEFADEGAEYKDTITIDASKLVPLVAKPHLPSNVAPVAECSEINIDQVVIGSCTNGRIEDLREAAEVLKGHRAAPNVRLIVIPATQAIYRASMDEGLTAIFLDAGAAVSTPTCGPCLGGHMGCLASGERAVATTNRNFVGRMGSPKSEVYLASPAVAAASAIAGHIATPEM